MRTLDVVIVVMRYDDDRYVSLTLEPVRDNMLLQLAAYVALLVSSKMSETCHLRMTNLESLTGRMFTPLQVREVNAAMLLRMLLPMLLSVDDDAVPLYLR